MRRLNKMLITIILCLLLCLTAGGALAAPVELIVGNVPIVQNGAQNNTALPAGVAYNHGTGTLTLTDAVLACGADELDNTAAPYGAAIYASGGELTIVLVGGNAAQGIMADRGSAGIYTQDCKVTVQGTGSLTAFGADSTGTGFGARPSYGILADGDKSWTIDADVTAAGGQGLNSEGFSGGIDTHVTVLGSLTATGGTAQINSYGVHTGRITVNGTLTATGGQAGANSAGISAFGTAKYAVMIEGGKVTAASGATGTATADNAGSHGIWSNTAVMISGGAVEATGGDTMSVTGSNGLYSRTGVIEISGGTVIAGSSNVHADSGVTSRGLSCAPDVSKYKDVTVSVGKFGGLMQMLTKDMFGDDSAYAGMTGVQIAPGAPSEEGAPEEGEGAASGGVYILVEPIEDNPYYTLSPVLIDLGKTVPVVKRELTAYVSQRVSSGLVDRTMLLDLQNRITYMADGLWVDRELAVSEQSANGKIAYDFPSDFLDIRQPSGMDVYAAHMITADYASQGIKAGDIELVKFEWEGEERLKGVATGASPFLFFMVPAGTVLTEPSSPWQPMGPDPGSLPQTGDSSHMALWLALGLAGVIGLAALKKRKAA